MEGCSEFMNTTSHGHIVSAYIRTTTYTPCFCVRRNSLYSCSPYYQARVNVPPRLPLLVVSLHCLLRNRITM